MIENQNTLIFSLRNEEDKLVPQTFIPFYIQIMLEDGTEFVIDEIL